MSLIVSFLARIPVPLADLLTRRHSIPGYLLHMVKDCSFYCEGIPECFSNYFYRSHFTHHWKGASSGVKHGNHSVITVVCSTSEKLWPFCKMSIFLMTLVMGGQVLSMNKLVFWLLWCLQSCHDFYPWQNWPCLSIFFTLWSLDYTRATFIWFPTL